MLKTYFPLVRRNILKQKIMDIGVRHYDTCSLERSYISTQKNRAWLECSWIFLEVWLVENNNIHLVDSVVFIHTTTNTPCVIHTKFLSTKYCHDQKMKTFLCDMHVPDHYRWWWLEDEDIQLSIDENISQCRTREHCGYTSSWNHTSLQLNPSSISFCASS